MFKVKICGITNQEDYNLINSLGVDFSGFIFYKGSPRYVSMETATEIIRNGISKSIKVGIFVNESIRKVREIYKTSGLDVVQLHGCETFEYCKELNLPYWKAIKVKSINSLKSISNYPEGNILLDTFVPGLPGGTGVRYPIGIIDEAINYKRNLIIAGGLSEKNIEEVGSKNIYGIDICSSVEKFPGKKDEWKIRSLFSKINTIKERNRGKQTE